MINYRIFRILPFFILLFTLLLTDALFCDQKSVDRYTDYYHKAQQFYQNQNYGKALVNYQKAFEENSRFAAKDSLAHFKIAYCLFNLGKHDSAVTVFHNEKGKIDLLSDYQDFFIIKSSLILGDTNLALRKMKQFQHSHSQSPLNSQIDSMLAKIYYEKKMWGTAGQYYQKLLGHNGFDKGDIYGKLIHISGLISDHSAAERYAFTLLQSYPFHPQSKKAYQVIRPTFLKQVISANKLKKIFRYLAKTDQFDEIDSLFYSQARYELHSELIRWLRIRKLYDQKKYWATLQACLQQKKKFGDRQFLREVDLHIARSYLRLRNVDKSISAYDYFQETYPNDFLTPEVIWVIAWLCEERGKIDQAREYYRELIARYPHYKFVREARFRIGLSYYRQAKYDTARIAWVISLKNETTDSWQSRFTYWIAKAHARESDSLQFLHNLQELAKTPFDSYYNLKAFLLLRSGTQIHQFVDSLLWAMQNQQRSFLPQYLDRFQRPLIINEILGNQYARRELNFVAENLNKNDWKLLFALGEMNERLNNFGRAYRLYRKIFAENFSRKSWREWIFLFKHLYPLYFNGQVNQYARRTNIIPASIWAIIKKESAFEPRIISYANAYGLMQIIPPTAERLSRELGVDLNDVRRLYNPNFNIFLGSYYLSQLLKRYDGNLYHALAAYNAGEHRVDRWRKVINTEDDDFFMENIEFEQTRVYVRGVMKFYWTYHLLIHPDKIPDGFFSFPQKVTHEPWFDEPNNFNKVY